MPKVSIVIPVYNAEKYLSRCIESFQAQTEHDFELILVNDGSIDNSGDLCESFAVSDNRICVLHQLNSGVSTARQVGLNHATTEYIIFADPDDWVDPTMLAELLETARTNNSDLVICDFFVNSSPTSKKLVVQRPKSIECAPLVRELILGCIHGSTWNKLYRLSLLKERGIVFPPKINYCEDLWFNCALLVSGNVNISYINRAYYHYDHFSNTNGLSRKFSIKSLHDYLNFMQYLSRKLDNDAYYREFLHMKYSATSIAFKSSCDKKEFYSLFPDDREEILKYHYSLNKPLVLDRSLALALKGHLALGRGILSVYERGYIPIAKHLYQLIHHRL